MKISSAFPSEYLKAADLQGVAVRVAMSHVTMTDLNGEPKPVLHFQGKDKGMIINKTNANKIAEMFGDDTDDWEGGEIILYEAMVDFQGKTVAAIRIRLAPRKSGNGNTAAPVAHNPMVDVRSSPKAQADVIDEDCPF